jgi:hypothetical protein
MFTFLQTSVHTYNAYGKQCKIVIPERLCDIPYWLRHNITQPDIWLRVLHPINYFNEGHNYIPVSDQQE